MPGIRILGVGIEEAHDLAVGCGQRTPHGIALAQRRPELGLELVLLHDGGACRGGTFRGPVGRRRVDHDQLIDQTGVVRWADGRLDHAGDGRGAFAGRDHDRDRRVARARAARRAEIRRPSSVGVLARSRRPGRPTARAPRGHRCGPRSGRGRRPAAGSGSCGGPRRPRTPRPRVLATASMPSDLAIDLGVDAQRRARKVVVGGVGVDRRDRSPSASRRLGGGDRALRSAAGRPRWRARSRPAITSAPRPRCASWRSIQSGAGSESASVVAIRPRGSPSDAQPLGGRVHPELSGRARALRPDPAGRVRVSPSRAAVSRATCSVRSLHASATRIVSNRCRPTVWAASASRHAPIRSCSSRAGTTTTVTSSIGPPRDPLGATVVVVVGVVR